MKLLKRFFDDVHLIAHTPHDITVMLSQEDRNLLANFHRRRPSVKKEAV